MAIGLRRRARQLAEEPCEVTLVTEPRPETHFGEGHFAFGQQGLGVLDAELDEVLMRSRPRRPLELARE